MAGSPVLAQQNPSHDQSERQQPASQSREPYSSPASTHFLDHYKVDAETYRTICDQPKDKDHADLCQQWRAAEAAEKQVLLSTLGLIAILATLFFTGWAAKAAARAAIAAERAVEVTSGTARRQLRAYVTVMNGPGAFQNAPTNFRFEFHPVIANIGQTPAHRVQSRTRIAVLPFPLPDGFDFPLLEAEEPSVATLGAQTSIQANAFADRLYSEDEIAQIDRGEMRVYCYGTVTYEDIFDEPHYTNFCFFMLWGSNSVPNWFNTRRHNDAN